jgi:hypothetical protein
MSAQDPKAPERFSLSRWSRRKREAARSAPAAPASADAALASAVAGEAPIAAETSAATAPSAQAPATQPAGAAPAAADALPPVDTLTFDSDFAAFMQPKVDEGTKRAALKTLFSNEHFNVMDGLDIYVGDYTQPDPMPEGMLDKLANVYEAVKPFDNGPAATDVALAPPAADGAAAEDAAPQTAVEDAPQVAVEDAAPEADAPPSAGAVGVSPPVATADETTTAVLAPVPAAAPGSA